MPGKRCPARAARSCRTGVGQPCYELPLITDGWTRAGLYRLASPAGAGGGVAHAAAGQRLRHARGSGAAPEPPRGRPAARRPADPHHRLLRFRRGGQDDDGGRAGCQGRRTRPACGGADGRSGAPAGPVDGPDLAGQHPAAGAAARRGRGGRRQPARHDARHEADLRRDRRGAFRSRPGLADPGEPVLPVAVVELCGPRSTWRWRSSASSGGPTST